MMNRPEPYGASPIQRQRELDAFEEQRQAYNTAMRDFQEAADQPMAEEATSPDQIDLMPVSPRPMAEGGPVGKTAREQMDSLPTGNQMVFTPVAKLSTGGSAADAVKQILAQMAAEGKTGADFFSSGVKLPATTETAKDLMLRSMTTGASTAEFDRYGGYDAVKKVYDKVDGSYSLDNVPAETLTALAQTVAQTGVGNLEILKKTNVPLSMVGFQNMLKNGIDPSSAAAYMKQYGTIAPVKTTPVTPVLPLPGPATNYTGSNLTGVEPVDYTSNLTSSPVTFNKAKRTRTGSLGQASPIVDYTSQGVGAVGDASSLTSQAVSLAKPTLFKKRPRLGAAGNSSSYFALTPETSTGLAPGTMALGSAEMPLAAAKTTLNALGDAPNLSPGMLGGVENAGYRTDRLGNRIYTPGAAPLFGFAKGGDIDLKALLAQNTETLSDDEPEESINTDPLGSAQKMMSDFNSTSQTGSKASPTPKAIKRTKSEPAKSGSAKMAYESLVKGDLGAMGTASPALKDTDSAQAQMQELARIYRLKAQASQERARGLSANTFGAPTLEQPTLTKGKLTSKRFNKGGEAKKSGVVEDIGRWLKNNDINPSDFLAALGRTGFAAGTALSPSTLNEGEDAELARRRAMPPTVDRSKGSPEGGEAKKPEAEKTESSGFFSSIFKGNDENFIKDIKNKAEKNEDYRAMLEYLKSKDAVPDIKTGYLPESLDAVFSALKLPFAGAVGSGTIKLNKNNLVDSGYKGDIGPSTLAHEMAHATDRQFEEQNSKQSGIFSKGNKFTDAYEKMVGDGGMRSGKKRTELARKLYPEWVSQNKEYRALPYEMAAHGVGNFAGPTTAEAAPPHVDATAATEFQILLDLARRNSNPPVKRAGGSTEEGELSQEEMDAASRPAVGNPNIARQVARTKALQADRSNDVNTLPDPQTYAFAQGMLGEAPDRMGFSPTHPDYKKIIGRGEQGMVTGGVSMIGPAAKALKALTKAGVKTVKPASSAALNAAQDLSSGTERMAIAQRNAALPIEQGGLGLPANNTAMDRAAAMGFDTDVFHGTSKDFLTFNPDKEVFAAELPEIANLYGKYRKGDGQRIMPLKIRGKQLTISDMDDAGKNNQFGYNLAKKLNLSDDEIEKLLIPQVRYPDGELIPGVKNLTTTFSDLGEREIINRLPKHGVDRLKVTDMLDMGGPQTQYMLPAGSDNVRSRFAAFDPFRRTAAVAAAMGAAAPDLLAGQKDKTSPRNQAR